MAIEPGSQKIVAAGIMNDVPLSVGVTHYDSLGNADNTYGSGGLANPPLGPNSEAALSLVLQPDGKAVVAGTTAKRGAGSICNRRGPLEFQRHARRQLWQRRLDQIRSATRQYCSGYGVGLQSSGKIVASGSRGTILTHRFGLPGPVQIERRDRQRQGSFWQSRQGQSNGGDALNARVSR